MNVQQQVGSLSSSPSGGDGGAWAALHQQHQQQQAAALQMGHAQRLHAALAHTPGLQNVSIEQVRSLCRVRTPPPPGCFRPALPSTQPVTRPALQQCVPYLEQVQALLMSGGLGALPGMMPRTQSASAMMQPHLAPPLSSSMLSKVRKTPLSLRNPEAPGPDR